MQEPTFLQGLSMSHDISAEATNDSSGVHEAAPNQLTVCPSERDHRQGSLSAKVVLVVYGDYQCFQSRELYTLIQTIQEQLNVPLSEQNYLCFIFRHFPQPQIHPQAQKAAEAAEAAAVQGQFWQMHETLLQHQEDLGDGYLVEYADNLGLDVTQFVRDIARRVYADYINQDIVSGMQSRVISAPALFVNGVRYRNALDLEPLLTAIVKTGSSS
jgi:protein-disulfide isomerase